MSNIRKLRPARNEVGLAGAMAGERCQFHPDCCDPDDFTCPGCGAPAVQVLTLTSAERGIRRVPFCGDHGEPIRASIVDVHMRQRREAN